MADRIKGITIEIGGDVTGLDKALSSTNKTINNTQSQLKDVERLLKLDPSNTILLEQKQQLLATAVGETKNKLDTLKDAERQVQEQIQKGDASEEQYQALQREIIATEQKLASLESAAGETKTALEKVADTASAIGDAAGNVAEKTSGLSTAAAGGVAALGALAVKAGLAADDLNTMAKQSGFSTEEIQKWQYAADTVDVSVETIVGAAGKMKKNMVSTSAEVAAAWETLGISVTDSNGQLRDSNVVFYEAIEALSHVENETQRDVLAMQLFGKSADSLAGIVDDGGAALRAMGDEAEAAGLILSQDALDGANEFNDGIDLLKAKASAAAMEAGASLAENLLPVMDGLVGKLSAVLEWLSNLDGTQLSILGTILLLVAAISPMAKLIQGITSVVTVATTAVSAISGGIAIFTGAATTGTVAAKGIASALSFITGPAGIVIGIIAAVVAAVVLLWKNCEGFRDAVTAVWKAIQNVFQNFINWFQSTFGPLWDKLTAALRTVLENFGTAVSAAWTVIQGAFQTFGSWFQSTFGPLWESLTSAMQRIFEGFREVIGAVWGAIQSAFEAFGTFLSNVFGVTWEGTFSDAQGVFETLKTVVGTIIDVLTTVFKGLIDFLSTVFVSSWSSTFDGIGNLFSAFKDSILLVIDGVKTAFSGVITFLTGVFTGDWRSAWEGVKSIFKGIFEALVGVAKTPINGIIGLINSAINSINGIIAGVNSVIGAVQEAGINLPSIPSISKVAYLARGGTLTAGNAIVGENGPELLSLINGAAHVTPLSTSEGSGGTRDDRAVAAGYNQTLNFYTAAMTPSEVARQTRNATRKMLAGVKG